MTNKNPNTNPKPADAASNPTDNPQAPAEKQDDKKPSDAATEQK